MTGTGAGHHRPDGTRSSPRVPAGRGHGRPAQLPSRLAALCERLPQDRIRALEDLLTRLTGPDDPLLGRFTVAQSAAGLSRQLEEMTQAWRAEAPDLPGAGLALVLATVRALPRPQPVQTVVSGPLSPAIPVRLTSGVALEVIRSADAALLIASFAAYGAEDVVAEIAAAAGRGVEVDLLLEESTHAAAAFSALPAEVRIWHRTEAGAGVLHAKLIAADRHTAFLGSANLTDRALGDNIELGVVVRDLKVVEPLVEHFRWLIGPANDVMRRV
ncbi:DISARM system phospholipase D-like protein DrmC [Streptomyces sp. NPDC087851]|uniref:DISARM system phospholipase D-like protein DrmC n=1 Tax=Streptomyces sp. NPDC087851 TaxID=3365810 RepID=UPI0038002B27